MVNKQISNNKYIFTDDNQVIAGKAGAIEVIVEAIENHMDNADICQQGCLILWSITLNGK